MWQILSQLALILGIAVSCLTVFEAVKKNVLGVLRPRMGSVKAQKSSKTGVPMSEKLNALKICLLFFEVYLCVVFVGMVLSSGVIGVMSVIYTVSGHLDDHGLPNEWLLSVAAISIGIGVGIGIGWLVARRATKDSLAAGYEKT